MTQTRSHVLIELKGLLLRLLIDYGLREEGCLLDFSILLMIHEKVLRGAWTAAVQEHIA